MDLPLTHYLAHGSSGVVYKYSADKVIKRPHGTTDSRRDHDIEQEIYTHLKFHPRLVHVFTLSKGAITMERLKEPLVVRLMDLREDARAPTRLEILRWAAQIAEGLQYIHSKGVLQADIGSQNLMLDINDNLKFIDFAGSSIDDKESFICSGVHYQAPKQAGQAEYQPTVGSEIFAMGSLLYEISTTSKPYHDRTEDAIEDLYAQDLYPQTDELMLGNIIQRCWMQQYVNAAEVLDDINVVLATFVLQS